MNTIIFIIINKIEAITQKVINVSERLYFACKYSPPRIKKITGETIRDTNSIPKVNLLIVENFLLIIITIQQFIFTFSIIPKNKRK